MLRSDAEEKLWIRSRVLEEKKLQPVLYALRRVLMDIVVSGGCKVECASADNIDIESSVKL